MAINKEYNDIQLDVKFTQASTRANLVSEENISVSFGKISKYFADLHSQAFTGYSHPTHTAYSSGLYKITVDSTGHVSGTAAVTASDLPAHTHSDYVLKTGDTMSGNLTFAVADGSDTPGIVFKRGNFTDSTLDWKIYNSSGALMMDRTVAGDTETWQNKFKVDGEGIWYGGTKVSLVGHTHNYAGSNSTGGSALTVYGTLTNPSGQASYAIPFHTDISSGDKSLLNNDGIVYTCKQGTASATGFGIIELGNAIDEGTAGNKCGLIRLYSRQGGGKYVQLYPATKLTANRNIMFPNAAGTVALTTDIPTVNDASLTLKGDGTDVVVFTANSANNKSLDITAGSNITITPTVDSDTGVGSIEITSSHPTITKSADTTSTASPAHGGTFTVVDSVTREANGHVTKINTKTVTLPADSNTDTKVTQSSSTTSDFRPLLLGKNNQTNPENLETTVTDQTYVTKHVFVQPSTGNLTLYNASGDSPSLIFRRGTMIDYTLEWRIQNVGGKLNFDRDKNESTETWENIFQLDPTNNKMYFKNTEVSLSGHTHNYAGSTTAGGAATNIATTVTNGVSVGSTYYGVIFAADPNISGGYPARKNDDFKYGHVDGTASSVGYAEIILGNNKDSTTAGNKRGVLTLYSKGTSYHSIETTETSTSVKHTLPATTGTILNSGTTSFTQTLSSGTKIGTIKINGTSTDLYCETNTNTDRYVNTASFADDSTNTTASPVKMTLTRAGSDTATVTANIPKVSSTSAGVAPKGTTVSSQSQSTKFLREDGSWAAPSYTSIPSNNVTGSGTSGYLTKWNGTNTITNGPQLGSSTTTYLRNDGSWATPPGTYSHPTYTERSKDIYKFHVNTLGHVDDATALDKTDVSTLINKLDTGSSTPVDADYYISQYVGGGTTTTSYHRRPMSALWSYVKGKADSVYSPIGHYHTLSIAADSGTNQLTLSASTKYKLTAGGSTFVFTTPPDTKNTAGSTDTSSKIYLIGATSQAANPQTYSDDQCYVTSGTLQANKVQASVTVSANTANSNSAGGVSLYGTDPESYGVMFRGTSNSGKHGYVQSDWATYFTMNDNGTTRGWVFRRGTTNVASVSGAGHAVFNGSVTVGGNSANTSGCRMTYNSTTQTLDFVFV